MQSKKEHERVQAFQGNDLNAQLGMVVVESGPERVLIDMPVGERCLQKFGYVHGGATLALLEAAGSVGAEMLCDLERERPFGVHMDVRHLNSCTHGMVHGLAELAGQQDLGKRGSRQSWRVTATDDEGNVMSAGTFDTRIVPLDYLQTRNARQGRHS